MSVRAGIVGARLDSVVAKEFAADVQYYLTQKPRQLPSRYLYDSLGSALFDAICRLPWYGITRAERRLVQTHGREVFDRLKGVSTIVELGSGDGEKLRMLAQVRPRHGLPLAIHLVDVSSSALRTSARTLSELDDVAIVSKERATELVALDDALTSLAKIDERKGKIVELRFFGGLSVEETAEAMKLSPVTVMREWRAAKAWLHREISGAMQPS